MNSMFTCFDALCAELLLGKTLTAMAPVAFSGDAKSSQRSDGTTEKATGKQFAEKTKTKKPQKIRSAPEFDGINCFETLVSY